VREADNLPPYSADVKKSRSLNSPRPLWACMACNGWALPFLLFQKPGDDIITHIVFRRNDLQILEQHKPKATLTGQAQADIKCQNIRHAVKNINTDDIMQCTL
jgi:hypothetical protein